MDRMKTSTERDITWLELAPIELIDFLQKSYKGPLINPAPEKDLGVQSAALYSICNKQYLEGGDKGNHYCHFTGQYRGAA